MGQIALAVNYWKSRAEVAEARATSAETASAAATQRADHAESKLSEEEKIAILPDAEDTAALVIPTDASSSSGS